MSNVLENTAFLSQLLIFGIIFSILMSVFVLVNDDIRDAMEPIYDIGSFEKVYNSFDVAGTVLEQGVHFLFAFFLSISLLSSAIERQNITSYVINFIIVILFSSAMVFVLSQLVTNLLGAMPVWVEFNYLPTWFLTNWSTIIIINIISFLAGFVFVKLRGAGVTVGSVRR